MSWFKKLTAFQKFKLVMFVLLNIAMDWIIWRSTGTTWSKLDMTLRFLSFGSPFIFYHPRFWETDFSIKDVKRAILFLISIYVPVYIFLFGYIFFFGESIGVSELITGTFYLAILGTILVLPVILFVMLIKKIIDGIRH